MKKYLSLLLGLLLVVAMPVTAFADADDGENAILPDVELLPESEEDAPAGNAAPESYEQATAELEPDDGLMELLEDWMTNGYPDDVGGVYWDDAMQKHVIELVAMDSARVSEIRSMLSNPDSVDFALSTYSYNELQAVQDEIFENDLDGETVYGMGIGWTKIDGELTGFGPTGKESRIVVSVHPDYVDDYAAKYLELYGDMVYVESGGPVVPQDDTAAAQSSMTLFYTTALFVLAAAGSLLWLRQRAAAIQTADGAVVAHSASLSRKQVVQAVRGSGIPPADDVFNRILDSI